MSESAVYRIPSSAFADFWERATAEIVSTITELLFYGILLVLSSFAINILVKRQPARSWTLIGTTALMLLFGTTQVFLRLGSAWTGAERLYVRVALGEAAADRVHSLNVVWNFLEDIALVTNNLVTDGVLIYRCYLIVSYLSRVLLIITTVLSYLAAVQGDFPQLGAPSVDLRVGFILGVLTNILLVGLIAGRIMYTRRNAKRLGIEDAVRRYNNATAMIIESGAIICLWTVIYVVARSIAPETVWRAFRGGLPQLLNIVPTLIIVRVGLGHAIDAQTTMQTRVGTAGASSSDKVAIV
ncbi:hypothetical protein MKEN_01242300 [Mycena kentingensis (nom. inval.)]|nr:hypothetical protein MKEN_01242300 [Mycena kentingensis (nom. inval.)]